MIALKTKKKQKTISFPWKTWGLFTLFVTTFIAILVFTNTYGLRTLLHLDTKIHSWSNIQDGQIIQRADNKILNLELKGRVGLLAESVEVATANGNTLTVRDNSYAVFDDSPFLTRFRGKIAVSPGWVKVFGRSKRGNYRRANGINIGIGEVFIVAGQSNASGSSKTLFLSESSDVRSGQLQEDNSILWKRGDDPQIRGGGGSPWPLVGHMLSKELDVPVGFINVAVGSSSIRDWQPGKPCFRRLVKALETSKPYGVRAILWHQGESDPNTTSDEYYRLLTKIINESQKYSSSNRAIPWVVARASYGNGKTKKSITEAQKKTWQQKIVFSGPDTDLLQKKYRESSDDVHFNELGTRKVAQMWFEKINNAFFS